MTWWHGFSLFVQNHRTKRKQPKCFRHVSMYCYFRWFFSPTKCFESQNHWFGQHLISATMWPLEGKNSAHTTLPLNALRFQCASPLVVTLGVQLTIPKTYNSVPGQINIKCKHFRNHVGGKKMSIIKPIYMGCLERWLWTGDFVAPLPQFELAPCSLDGLFKFNVTKEPTRP